MEPEVTAALIALGGVIVSVVLSAIIGFFNTRFGYNQLFAQTVSSNRMDWINVWRENISKFLACAEFLHNHKDKKCKKCCEYEKEMYQAKSMIISRLNMTEDLHCLMKASLDKFDYNTDDKTFEKKREYVLELARQILKPEWERLKDEAKGKRR